MTNAAFKPAVVVGWLGVWVVSTSHEMAVITFAHGSCCGFDQMHCIMDTYCEN